MPKYSYEKNDNTYLTPYSLIKRGLQILNQLKGHTIVSERFDLDVCCSNTNIPANNYYTHPEHDGLRENWMEYNWCNPPFDQCKQWVQKAYGESLKGNTTIMLIPVRTETSYWHEYILYKENVDIHWLRKGYRFLNPKTKEELGVFKNALAFVVFKGVKDGVR